MTFEDRDKIFYSPLAGCSDYPFREMAARYRPTLMFCEMTHAEEILRNVPSTFEKKLRYSEVMRPIGAQLCGSCPQKMAKAALIAEELGFDVIDLNCGCPVDKVTDHGGGSALLKSPASIGEIIAAVVAVVKVPVTVKVRAGWDAENIVAPQVTRLAEEAGAQAIFVHGRTREQAYRGGANWDYITACKKEARKIKVIGNGDVFSPEAAKAMLEQTKCDGVLVSRGTLGAPWIAEDIRRSFSSLAPLKRVFEDYRRALLEHFDIICSFKEPREALLDMRRVACWYFKNVGGASRFRGLMSHVSSLKEAKMLIENFDPTAV